MLIARGKLPLVAGGFMLSLTLKSSKKKVVLTT